MTSTADSAGVPWSGRTLGPQPFAGDAGEADPALAAALAGYRRRDLREEDVVAALAASRLMAAVVATLGETADGPAGLPGDKSADMALVTLTGDDGRRALPVFTGLASLAAWDAAARPVPVQAARAALSAVAEGCEVLVVDPAGPAMFVVRRPAVWALAQGRRWVASSSDVDVREALGEAGSADGRIVDVLSEPGERSELRVVLRVAPGLDPGALQALIKGFAARLAADEVIAERVDSMELRVLPAG